MEIKENMKILFQGDSITDSQRSREDLNCLGHGYANMISAYLGSKYPEFSLQFINRGISGNRVCDLKERWTKDCIELNPDVVSILIGINDTWRRFDQNDPTSAKSFESDYVEILKRVKKETDAKIIILEPFLLSVTKEQATLWRDDLEPKIRVCRELAKEFKATYIPLDGLFAAKCVKRENSFWANDGVHPTKEGHAFIATKWVNQFEA